MKKIGILLAVLASSVILAAEPEPVIYNADRIKADIKIPYKRPLGFTYNFGSMASMTFEGRFFVGLVPQMTLVISPSFQYTPTIPFYDFYTSKWLDPMNFMRLNLGVGLRGHFYKYDSWDGWYLEAMARGGATWIGDDKEKSWSLIPSLIVGYQTVYESGYTINIGFGFEWEFLFGENKDDNHKNREALQAAYYNITKLPLTGEISLGWSW
jgi:hypothetical protein